MFGTASVHGGTPRSGPKTTGASGIAATRSRSVDDIVPRFRSTAPTHAIHLGQLLGQLALLLAIQNGDSRTVSVMRHPRKANRSAGSRVTFRRRLPTALG